MIDALLLIALGILLANLVLIGFFIGASHSEEATFDEPSELSAYLAEQKARVHRMEFRRLSRDVETWRAGL